MLPICNMKNVLPVLILIFFISSVWNIVCNPPCGTPPNDPFGKKTLILLILGEEKGIFPGRVVYSHRKNSTLWDGKSNYYWSNENTNYDVVKSMLDLSITALAGTKSVKEAWDAIFKHFNQKKSGKNIGYSANEKIAVKMNLNCDSDYQESNADEVTPQFLKALVTQMCSEYGVQQEDLYFFDASRTVSPKFWEAPTGIGKDFPNINFVDNKGEKDYVKVVEKDEDTKFIMSSDEVPDKEGTKLPKILTQAKYVMEINNFRGHSMAGMTETGKNWFGSIWRPHVQSFNHWSPSDLHPFIDVNKRKMATYNVLVDLLGHNDTAGKGLLFLTDGFYGGPSQMSAQKPIKFSSSPFDNWWSSSIFVSIDPIAIDSVMFDFLRNEPNVPYANKGCIDNFLHEGAKADNPPSGIVYNPTGTKQLSSLGVHEHWNNANEKLYSRNMGKDKGIELVIV